MDRATPQSQAVCDRCRLVIAGSLYPSRAKRVTGRALRSSSVTPFLRGKPLPPPTPLGRSESRNDYEPVRYVRDRRTQLHHLPCPAGCTGARGLRRADGGTRLRLVVGV